MGEVVQFIGEIGIVVHEGRVRPHALGHFHAHRAVRDTDRTRPEAGTESHGAESEDAQSHDRHVLAGLELRLVVAQGAERVQVAVYRVLVMYAVGNLDEHFIVLRDELGQVRVPGDDSVAHGEILYRVSHAADHAQVAVAYPARKIRCSGHLLRAFVVAPVRPDLERRYDGFHPEVVRAQVFRIQGMVFDAEVSWAIEHGDFHEIRSNQADRAERQRS